MNSIDRFRGAILATLVALFALTVAGCHPKDDTLTAAPTPAPGAKAPPPTNFKQPRQRLPPLVGNGGGKAPMTSL